MNTEERFLLRSSVEWRKNLMQDCLCMPCADFILGKPAQFCPETSDAFTRKEHTRQLSAMLERYIDPRNDPRIYWAREVTFDYSTNHKIRVDYMRFQPLNNSTSGIEKGDFYAYEVKSSVEDFKSPNGHNFIADYNYYVMPADVFEAVKDTVPYGVGVLCPDGGHLRCVRKAVRKDRTRPVSEMLLMLWRSSRREIVGRRNKNDKETNDRQD